jgi:putative ABC transport system permease protein
MIQNYISFCIKLFRSKQANSFFIIAGTSITAATVVLLLNLQFSKENPRNVVQDLDRLVITSQSIRAQEGNTWNAGLNFRYIKEHIETIDELELATVYHSERTIHWVNEARVESQMLYADANFNKFINLNILHGSYFNKEDYLSGAKVMLVSERSARLIFGRVDVVGESLKGQTENYKIIGVYENIPAIRYLQFSRSFDEIVPLTTDDLKDRATTIDESAYDYVSLVKAKTKKLVPTVIKKINDVSKDFEVRPEGMTMFLSPYLAKSYLNTKIKQANSSRYLLNKDSYQFYVTTLLLVSILSVICLVNISNLTMTSLINRNVEFGVRYAFGANFIDMYRLAFSESIVYSSISFILSLLVSQIYFLALNALDYTRNLNYELDLQLIGIAAIYSLFIPIFSYLISVYKINKQMPVSLLKGEM